jgi:type I restriction enzyme M protein
MKADGFSLDDKRTPTDVNDIPDIIQRFHNLAGETERQRTDRSFLVPKKEIQDNDYDLSINKYKKVEHVQEQYPPTKQIIAEIRELEKELSKNLDVLEGML